MTTTGYEVLGASFITGIAVLGKLLENGAHFHAARAKAKNNNVGLYYECCNFHLHLSLGMLGLAWSQHWDTAFVCPFFGMILLGVTTKGVIAHPKPGTLNFWDRNAFLGLYFPNILGLICVAWALFGREIVSSASKALDHQTQQTIQSGPKAG